MLDALLRLREAAPRVAAFARDARDATRLATDLFDRVVVLAERLDGSPSKEAERAAENVIPMRQDARGVWTATRNR